MRPTYWLFSLIITTSSFADDSTLNPYILHYQGKISATTEEISKQWDEVFSDVDRKRVVVFKGMKSIEALNYYQFQGYLFPASQVEETYFQNYLKTHSEFKVGDATITPQPIQRAESLSTFDFLGPDEQGKEVKWGSFQRIRTISLFPQYDQDEIDTMAKITNGEDAEFRKFISTALKGIDGELVSWWLGQPKHPARMEWNSKLFFILKDGSSIERLVSLFAKRNF